MSTMLVVIIMFVVLGIGGYVFLMIFYPEWVGITGSVAESHHREHQGDSTPEKPHQEPKSSV